MYSIWPLLWNDPSAKMYRYKCKLAQDAILNSQMHLCCQGYAYDIEAWECLNFQASKLQFVYRLEWDGQLPNINLILN